MPTVRSARSWPAPTTLAQARAAGFEARSQEALTLDQPRQRQPPTRPTGRSRTTSCCRSLDGQLGGDAVAVRRSHRRRTSDYVDGAHRDPHARQRRRLGRGRRCQPGTSTRHRTAIDVPSAFDEFDRRRRSRSSSPRAPTASTLLVDAVAPLRLAAQRRVRRRSRCRSARRVGLRPATEGVPMRSRLPFTSLAIAFVRWSLVAACSGSVRAARRGRGRGAAVDRCRRAAGTRVHATRRPLRTRLVRTSRDGPLPAPGEMPDGSTMAAIRERGRLIVGVSGDTLLFGARNPLTDQIEGFDIDMLKEVARAIFGDDGDVPHRRTGSSPTPTGCRSLEAGRRRRHRRPHDDDQLRPLAAHRLLVRVLRRRPEGAGEDGLRLHRASRTSTRPAPRCARPRAAPTSTSPAQARVHGFDSWSIWQARHHRLPGGDAAGRGRRGHRRRHRARRPRRAGPEHRGVGEHVHRGAVRPRASARTTSTSCSSSTA